MLCVADLPLPPDFQAAWHLQFATVAEAHSCLGRRSMQVCTCVIEHFVVKYLCS